MVNQKEVVKKLVEKGMDEKMATEKVAKIVEAVNSKMSGESEAKREKAIKYKLKDLYRIANLDTIKGVAVGCTELRDRNEWVLRQAQQIYEENPKQAVDDGYVKMENDEVVYLDNREFLDKGETMKNRNYGKPIRPNYQREIIFATQEHGLVRGFGNVKHVELGAEYRVVGNFKADKGTVSISAVGGIQKTRQFEAEELWDIVYEITGDSEFSYSMTDVLDRENGDVVITRGMVKTVKPMSNGGVLTVLEDEDVLDGVMCFSSSEEVEEVLDEIENGMECIIFGRVNRFTGNDDEERFNIQLYGIIPDPHSGGLMDALSEVDDILSD